MKRYESEKEVLEVVRGFESGTISREDWRHAEHLTVALYYIINHGYDAALVKMRDGIFNLLRAFKVDLSKEMPYHETMTVFWIGTVADFNATKNGVSLLDKANELAAGYDKDYPFKFYTREYLFSDEARAAYVEPNLWP